jgi:hypothetical protein
MIDAGYAVAMTVIWGTIMFVLGMFLGYRSAHKKVDELIKEIMK